MTEGHWAASFALGILMGIPLWQEALGGWCRSLEGIDGGGRLRQKGECDGQQQKAQGNVTGQQ